MSGANLPYILAEGQKAYAAQVMANFYALLNSVNQVTAGSISGDIDMVLTSLKTLIDACVVASVAGNARQIKFDDGDTMQNKLNNGDFNGVDAFSVMNHMYKLYVDIADGHLKAVLPAGTIKPPLAIDNKGHLIYTVTEETKAGAAVTYDLGKVKGEPGATGAPGGMQASIYDTTGRAKDIFAEIETAKAYAKPVVKQVTLLTTSWNSTTKTITVSLAGITAAGDFDIDTAYTVTATQQAIWLAAKPKVTAQVDGSFTITALGDVPQVDIPLTVRLLPA